MGDFTKDRFEQVNTGGCADTTCGRSVVVNEDPCPDCCGGGSGEPGQPGQNGKDGKDGAPGRPPLIRCGCLPTNPKDGGSGGPIQQQCIDDITGKVVMSSTSINYYSGKSTSNSFFQYNCNPGGNSGCGYFNVTNPNQANPALGNFTGDLGTSSTDPSGDKYIVAWGYIGTGNVPNVNYTWKYGDFKKLSGYDAVGKLTATQGQKFTFMPTDSLFTGNGQIDLGGWKSLVTGTADPAGDLVAAFLNEFPQCATDGTGTPPGPLNGQGGNICTSAGGECTCEGCTADNQLQNCDDIAAGDVFIDACNKIMYIAGENGAFPANGIPFGPEDTPCPPKEECPSCPDCPQPEPCGTCSSPKAGQALQQADWCKCSGALGTLFGLIGSSGCVCAVGGALPKCPQECKKTNGTSFSPPQYYYQDPKKECPCNDDGDTAKCPQQCDPPNASSKWYQDKTKECPCGEGTTDAGCMPNCAAGKSRICPEECPKCPTCPACDSCCPGGTAGSTGKTAPCTSLALGSGTIQTFCPNGADPSIGTVTASWSVVCNSVGPCQGNIMSSTGTYTFNCLQYYNGAVDALQAQLSSFYAAMTVSLNCDGSPAVVAFIGGGE